MLGEEHRSKEDLLAENKVLKKQKEELILNFRKQHKLTDIHKRQKVKVVLLLHILAESLDQKYRQAFFFFLLDVFWVWQPAVIYKGGVH